MVNLAFFKAEFGQLDDKLIDFFSGRVGYSHCEFIVDATTTIGSHALAGGVAEFKYNDIYSDVRWDILSIPDADYETACEYAYKQIGRPYDFIGVALHYVHIDAYQSREGAWCSELTHEIVKASLHTYSYEDDLPMPNEHYQNLFYKNKGRITKRSVSAHPARKFSNVWERDYLGRVSYGRDKNGR